MDLIKAKELTLTLISKHGLVDWRFSSFNSLRCLGRCNYKDKTISLSVQLVQHGTDDLIKDTILHEIAHALVPDDAHGMKWRMKAHEIGAKPTTCAETSPEIFASLSPYRGVCRACGYTVPIIRKTSSQYYHKGCRKGWMEAIIDIIKN